MKLAELFLEAGLPPGVFNVVNGDKEAVDAIINNKDMPQLVSLVQHLLLNIFTKTVQKMKKSSSIRRCKKSLCGHARL